MSWISWFENSSGYSDFLLASKWKSSSLLLAVWSWVAGFQAFCFPCFHCYAVCLYICRCVNEWTLVVFSTITIANWARRDIVSTTLRHSFVHQSVILFLFSLLIVGFLFSNVALRVCRHTENFGGQWTWHWHWYWLVSSRGWLTPLGQQEKNKPNPVLNHNSSNSGASFFHCTLSGMNRKKRLMHSMGIHNSNFFRFPRLFCWVIDDTERCGTHSLYILFCVNSSRGWRLLPFNRECTIQEEEKKCIVEKQLFHKISNDGSRR